MSRCSATIDLICSKCCLVPGHELGVDCDLRPATAHILQGREQLASQDGHALISLNAIEQRIVRLPLAAVKPNSAASCGRR
jgi:hypothetical protein